MKIALLAPPYLPVPPAGYGGTEQIVHYLTEGLVKKGHDVTLFASGDSKTNAKLVSVFPQALGNSGEVKKQSLLALLHYIECFLHSAEFDIIHNHAQYLAMFLAQMVKTPIVHTIHGSFAKGEVQEDKRMTLRRFKHHHYVSISRNQQSMMPDLNWAGTVYNGIDLDHYPYNPIKGDYLLWVGRVTPKKGPVEAIEVAKAVGATLKIAAVVDPVDQKYFDQYVKPQIDGKQIQLIGELEEGEKAALYGKALCILYPIFWHEPFGLVMVESMACGTPVVAYTSGSVPEVVTDGVTGFLVNLSEGNKMGEWIVKETGVAGMVEAVKKISWMSQEEYDRMLADCRKHLEENFTKERMVEGYERIYRKIVSIK